MDNKMKKKVARLIESVKNEVFEKEYRSQVTDAEVLGIMISKYFSWNGIEVLKTASSALEDCNYHSENAEIVKMIEHVESVA